MPYSYLRCYDLVNGVPQLYEQPNSIIGDYSSLQRFPSPPNNNAYRGSTTASKESDAFAQDVFLFFHSLDRKQMHVHMRYQFTVASSFINRPLLRQTHL
ncbi:hypothetical protein J6590_063466 [Homalodisca vitripennis]|nr:hypothetical protein J6590_063466 [Homalodisca vitripennis]